MPFTIETQKEREHTHARAPAHTHVKVKQTFAWETSGWEAWLKRADRSTLKAIWKEKKNATWDRYRSDNITQLCVCVRMLHSAVHGSNFVGFEVDWMSDPKTDCFPYDVWLSHLGFQYKRNEPITARWRGFAADRNTDTITSSGMSCENKHTYCIRSCLHGHTNGALLQNTMTALRSGVAHTCFHFI